MDWWGKGKGKGQQGHRDFKAEQKVWIGSLPSTVTFQTLQPLMKQAGNCKWVEVFQGGTGVACFATADEAQAAIAQLNGSSLEGATIEVDTWVRMPREQKVHSSGDPEKDSLIQKIKAGQRASQQFKEAWHGFCKDNGHEKFDPARHENQFLKDFLESGVEIPEGKGSRSNPY